MSTIFFIAGIIHLNQPEVFLPIVPDWVPMPRPTILITGICEIAGAAALLTRRFRAAAGLMLALYAICVFPANIKHAFDAVAIQGVHLNWWYHAPRLAFQPVIVWWALFCSGVINWPFNRTPS